MPEVSLLSRLSTPMITSKTTLHLQPRCGNLTRCVDFTSHGLQADLPIRRTTPAGRSSCARTMKGKERLRNTELPPQRILNRVRAGNKQNDEEPAKEKQQQDSEAEQGSLLDNIEGELGRQFGGVVWFSVLLFCLALFGGGYTYLIVNFADFSDIPMLRGPLTK